MEVECVYFDTCPDKDERCDVCQNNKNLRLYILLSPEEAVALNKYSELTREEIYGKAV